MLQVLPLRNFRPEESRAYLTSRRVREPLQAEALGFTHGNRSRCRCSPTCTGCSLNALRFAIPM